MEMGARRTRKETENKNGVIARRGLRVSLLGGWMDGWMDDGPSVLTSVLGCGYYTETGFSVLS
jgi:hypothetical protein